MNNKPSSVVRDCQGIDNWIDQTVEIIKNDCDIIYLKVQRFHVSPSNTLRQLGTGAKKALPQQKQIIEFLLGVLRSFFSSANTKIVRKFPTKIKMVSNNRPLHIAIFSSLELEGKVIADGRDTLRERMAQIDDEELHKQKFPAICCVK